MENRSPQNMRKKQLLELINNSVNGIQTQHDKVKQLTDEIEKQKDKTNKYLSEIETWKQKASDWCNEINKEYNNIKDLNSTIHSLHNNSNTLVSEMGKQKGNTDGLTEDIQKQSNVVGTYVSEIEKQKDKTDDLTDNIQKQCETASKIIEEKDQKLKTLIEKINSLLPGATSAGLASSYLDAQTEKKTKWYWIGFIVSLVVVGVAYSYYFLKDPQDINLENIIIRIIVGGPLIWIAWYCQKSISQTNRVKEEYHHKQRIMSVFEGFSKQIDELTKDDPEKNKVKKLELISVIINAIKKNPSEILDPSETFLDSIRKCVNEKKNEQKEKDENLEK